MERKINSQVEIDPSISRLFEKIEEEGGVQRVSEKIEKSSVSMYNYRNKGVAPNWNYVLLLASKFENWDLNKLFRGVSLNDNEIEKIKKENEFLKKEIESLREEKDLFKKFALKGNFNEVFTEDQFVDNLDNLENLKDGCLKTRLIGQAYYKDLVGEA